MDTAAKKSKPNERLRRQRELRCWTLQEVADRLYDLCFQDDEDCPLISSDQVGRWERGVKPHPKYQAKLCTLYDKSPEELGFLSLSEHETVTGISSPHEGMQLIQVLVPNGSSATIQIHPYALNNIKVDSSKDDIIEARQLVLSNYAKAESDDEMNRRQAIKAITAGSALIVAQEFFDPETWDRLSRSLTKKPSGVDHSLIEGLKKTVDSQWALRLLGNISFSELLSSVTGHLQVIIRLLQNPHPLSITIGLHSVASEAAQLAGVLMFDMGYYASAKSSYQFSLDTAKEANNSPLAAVALGRISIISATQDDHSEALLFLKDAQRLAKQQNAFTLLSWLKAEEAEAYAQLQQQKACRQALEQGATFINHIQPDEDTYGVGFNPSRLLAYEGTCYMRLHQPEEALRALLSGLNSPETPEVFKRLILTDIAEASIQAGAIDQACNYLDQSLDLIEQLDSKRSLKDIRKLRQALEPWSNAQAVKKLDERLNSVSVA
jgi:tetratricopeptide (TPR) repeat protein